MVPSASSVSLSALVVLLLLTTTQRVVAQCGPQGLYCINGNCDGTVCECVDGYTGDSCQDVGNCTILTSEPLRVLVPLYTYPGDPSWAAVASAQTSYNYNIQITAIINPNSGPVTNSTPGGNVTVAAYATGITNLINAGVHVVGYVPTWFANSTAYQNIDFFKAMIDAYVTFYNVTGIFFDQANTTTSNVAFYAELYNYAKDNQKYNQFILNPGVPADVAYLAISTNIVVFENTLANINNITKLPSYVQCSNSSGHISGYKYKFSAIVNTDPSSNNMYNYVNQLWSAGIGNVYLTNGTGSNAYNYLPSYFTSEVDTIYTLNLAYMYGGSR